jgi:hypothetical protein
MSTWLHSLAIYGLRYWKPLAGLALTGFVGLNAVFDWIPPAGVTTIVGAAAALGIGLHHKGDPLPPAPPH